MGCQIPGLHSKSAKNVSRLSTSGAFMHEIVAGMVARLIRLSSSDPSSNPSLLNYIFSPNRALNSAILTQMVWIGIFLSSTIIPNSSAATRIRTHVSRVAPDWDLSDALPQSATQPRPRTEDHFKLIPRVRIGQLVLQPKL